MKLPVPRTIISYVGLVMAMLIIANCGGGGGPAGPPPGVPVISNLTATLLPALQRCTVRGQAGSALDVSFDYRDSDGNVRGGKVQTTGTFLPSGDSIDVVFDVPSASATITGTTEGTIRVFGCVRFGRETGFKIAVALLDTANNSSNIVSSPSVAFSLADEEGFGFAPRT